MDIGIREDQSAIENFVRLNELSGYRRKIVPMTSSKQPFVDFSEKELVAIFWKNDKLKRKILQMTSSDGFSGRTMNEIFFWIGGKEPGFLIKNLLVDVDPEGLSVRKRGKIGYRGAVKLLTLDEIGEHLRALQRPDFNPVSYHRKGYVLRGSVRTDGFRIQLTAFKLRELHMVKYRRLPVDCLPDKFKTTVGGVDYFMQEIRNVVKTKADVQRLWPGAQPEDVKILTLDAGQAFVVGAFAHVPTTPIQEPPVDPVTDNATPAKDNATPEPLPFRNLAVNQKAVYQPNFRFRRWLETEKDLVPSGESNSVATVESLLPPLKGPTASVCGYVEELGKVEARLQEFYSGNNNRFKKHQWDMERARKAEYQAIADRLLGAVGGSIGRKKEESDPVLIGIGLGQFNSNSRLSSLHSTFLDFFVRTVSMQFSVGQLIVWQCFVCWATKLTSRWFLRIGTFIGLYCPWTQ